MLLKLRVCFPRSFVSCISSEGIGLCSHPHVQVTAESTAQQVTLARCSICCAASCQNSAARVLQLFTLHFCLGSRNSHLLPRLLLQSYYRAETGFSPLSQFSSQLLLLLPTAERAWAITFIQCPCFPHVNPDVPLACQSLAPVPLE